MIITVRKTKGGFALFSSKKEKLGVASPTRKEAIRRLKKIRKIAKGFKD